MLESLVPKTIILQAVNFKLRFISNELQSGLSIIYYPCPLLEGIIWGIFGMISALPIWIISMEISRSFNALAVMNYLMEDGLSEKKIYLKNNLTMLSTELLFFFEEKQDEV